jgi:hypothetical protein
MASTCFEHDESGVPLNLQMNETHILSRLLRMYIPWNWEFGSALSKLRNFEGWGVEPPPPRTSLLWGYLLPLVRSQNLGCRKLGNLLHLDTVVG